MSIKSYSSIYFESSKLYVRFGDIPKSKISTNWRNNSSELGLSVYPCKVINGKYQILDSLYNQNFKINKRTYVNLVTGFIKRRIKAFLVSGDLVGKGSDNEPLLINVEIIKKLKQNDLTDTKMLPEYIRL